MKIAALKTRWKTSEARLSAMGGGSGTNEETEDEVYSSIIRGVTVGDVVAMLIIVGVTAYAGLRIALLY